MTEEIIINNKCFIASQTDLKEYMDNMTEEIKVIPTNGTSADDVKYAKRVEEVYIDGVNVAGCEYMLNNKIKGKQHCPAKAMPYAKETSCICRKSIDTPYNFCKHNPNCHYKQLKRLEQERDEL